MRSSQRETEPYRSCGPQQARQLDTFRAMPEDPILVRTSSVVIAVPADRFDALLERLERTEEGKPVADELRERNAVSDESKRILVRTLRLWIDDLGVDDMGADLNNLRYELMRDLNIPPWDTD